MITLFTLPKPFVRAHRDDPAQRDPELDALHPDIDILMFGNERGTAEIAAEFGLRHFPDVDVNEYGTPRMTGYFQQAEEAARHSRMCYVNADIILFPDLLEAVAKVDLPKFVMGGPAPLTSNSRRLQPWIGLKPPRGAEENGALASFSGIDYFVYPRGMFGEIPRFALGRWYWDNWLVYRARRLGGAHRCKRVRDGDSPEPRLQSHRRPGSKDESRNQGGIEAFGNRLLVKSILMTLEDADWQVDRYGLSRTFRWTRWHLLNEAALQRRSTNFPRSCASRSCGSRASSGTGIGSDAMQSCSRSSPN